MPRPEDALDVAGDVRVDPLTGAVVVVAAARQGRPDVHAGDDTGAGCPFCPGGLEAPDPYETRWFPNRWPPLPGGRAELLLYAPDHDASLASLGQEGALRVVALWAERTAAQAARADVAYVLLFENRGAAVGATVAHPHGQLYAFPFVPAVPAAELAAPACDLCRPPDPGRLVAASGGWRAEVPEAPSWPFELRVAPSDHVPDVPAAEASHPALAAVLVDALARLDQLFDAPMPYMLWWHQRPTDGGAWPQCHVHAHVAPLLRAPGTPRFVAAGELGSGVAFNPVVPEAAAARLRTLPGTTP